VQPGKTMTKISGIHSGPVLNPEKKVDPGMLFNQKSENRPVCSTR